MNENKKTPPALKALFGDQIEFRESSLYDSDPITNEIKPIIWFDNKESTRQLPPECIADCSGSGDQYDNVKWWVEKLNFDGPVDQFKEHLDQYGNWDDKQLEDHYENRIRVLWLWACDCSENPGSYDYLYLGA